MQHIILQIETPPKVESVTIYFTINTLHSFATKTHGFGCVFQLPRLHGFLPEKFTQMNRAHLQTFPYRISSTYKESIRKPLFNSNNSGPCWKRQKKRIRENTFHNLNNNNIKKKSGHNSLFHCVLS